VKVLDKAIDILDIFTLRRKELSISEIVHETRLNRSTVIRLVANLERRGLLQRMPDTRRYRLGQRLFEMGSIVYSSFSLRDAAAETLRSLEQRSTGTILLAMRSGEHTVIVDRRQGTGGPAMASIPGAVGDVHPLTYGPLGHLVMATLTPDVVEELLDKYPLEQRTPYSIVDRDRFLDRLPKIRSDGYAVEVNEVAEGLMGMAAPILDFAGNIVGGLALGFPATRENDAGFLESALRDLRQATAEISANMGYSPDEVADEEQEPAVDGSNGGQVQSCDSTESRLDPRSSP
jgi:DNA-binding IclR family transcriptional regulator